MLGMRVGRGRRRNAKQSEAKQKVAEKKCERKKSRHLDGMTARELATEFDNRTSEDPGEEPMHRKRRRNGKVAKRKKTPNRIPAAPQPSEWRQSQWWASEGARRRYSQWHGRSKVRSRAESRSSGLGRRRAEKTSTPLDGADDNRLDHQGQPPPTL
jgi:hypothetical protein